MKKKSKDKYLSCRNITDKYGVPKSAVHKYFPAPELRRMRSRRGRSWAVEVWPEAVVEQVIRRPEVAKIIDERRRQQLEARQTREITDLFADYSPDAYLERARRLERSFVLHVGPTNSGKTFEAVEDLKQHLPGAYLGPLRLLALEMYDKLNAAGVPCSLLTGEESIPVENAEAVASTIELCDCHKRIKTAIIDEAQMIADPSRGAAWLKAICLVDAEVVHICMAPEALGYIERLIQSFDGEYRIRRHKRLAPLTYAGRCTGYSELQPDDALICFSRKSVLSTAALLERNGFRASVIYGALPPEARRNEVRRYLRGETNIVVATDAIGLGISLPIRRIIFAETEKFDGKQFRALKTSEVNQIGGRAGRYGLHERGEVLTMGEDTTIADKLGKRTPPIRAACIAFPRETLAADYSLRMLLKTWQTMPNSSGFMREDMHDALMLLNTLKPYPERADKELIFDLITCPIDARNDELVHYWVRCAWAILRHRRVPEPYFDTETLLGCELQYKAYDIRHQLLRRIGEPDDCTRQRRAICDKIAELMQQSKAAYIRKCKYCGKELPIGTVLNVCADCLGNVTNY